MAETFTKGLGICPVLETGQEIIGKTEQVRFAPTMPADPPLKPKVQDVMEVDIRKEGGEYTSYKVANLPIEFSRSIPRVKLRPGYGDGFRGAPLEDRGLE